MGTYRIVQGAQLGALWLTQMDGMGVLGWEGGARRGYMYAMADSPVVQQKPTTRCKAIIIQLKTNKNKF